MGNNEMMAMANAREIEKLPYETLKALFPSVRYMVQMGMNIFVLQWAIKKEKL